MAVADELDRALVRPNLRHRMRRRTASALAPLIRMVRRPGVSVAVLGPDGAGKTTLIGSVAERFFFPTRTYYLGLYGGSRRSRSGLRSLAGRAFIGQLATVWRAYLAAAIERRRGRLVIFDRYGSDALLPSRRGRSTWKRRARGLLIGRLSPRPDMVVLLDAAPAQLLARKNEHSAETLERQRRGYLAIAERWRATVPVVIVDAGQDASTVHREVVAALWRAFALRRRP
jgi:thymidylate kinase